MKTVQKNGKEISGIRKSLPQILAIAVKNVLLFGFGMTLGFPTILIPKLSGNFSDEKISLDQEAISWIGSLNYLCVPLGCILSGSITQPFGRKRAMQIVNIPFLASWLFFYFATEKWHLFLALGLTGATGGLLEAPTITYLSEVTTPNLRGVLASSTTVSVIGGTLLIIVMGSVLHWKTVALCSCISPVISVILLFFVPESPYWLISKNRLYDAQKSIAWLRGWVPVDDVKSEFDDLYQQINSTTHNIPTFNTNGTVSSKIESFRKSATLYIKKDFLWPFGLVSLAFFLGHFSGMTTLLTYAVNLFETLGSPINNYNATIILSLAQVIGCIFSSSLVHFTGKRKVNFLSMLGCGVCFAVVSFYAYHYDVRYLVTDSKGHVSLPNGWIPMSFLIGSALFAAVGIRILPWMLIGEVYYNEIRATASGFSTAVNYILGFLANKTFFTMINLLTLPGTFVFFSALCFSGFVMLYFWLPETEMKTIFEVNEHFAGKIKLSNTFKSKRRKTCKKNGIINDSFYEV